MSEDLDLDLLNLGIRQYPNLLTQRQEIELGSRVQAYMKVLAVRPQNSDSEDSGWAKAANMSQQQLRAVVKSGTVAKQRLIGANLRLVIKQVRPKLRKTQMPFSDLESVCK